MWDFLTLKIMITPYIIVGVYWFGALSAPILAYYLAKKLISKKNRSNIYFRVLFFLFFFMGEIAWRIFVEFFLAYFQMREALLHIASSVIN